ncbi:uncharacterized protein LOC127808103 isoform X2 [Diospyros lotus]|uniref:uncharacterized protein LOC127808103 isoform X2 n=1 Tax=Diospyros lotus TaxID=55363 RepID=UPI00225A1CF0|nr:uncharacterized protein LOC127808103 isoform X2 [Diospyros lotus]
MLRLCNKHRRCIRFSLPRVFSSSASPSGCHHPENSAEYPKDVRNPQQPLPMLRHSSPPPLSPLPNSLSRPTLVALSVTLISALAATSYVLITDDEPDRKWSGSNVEWMIDRSSESARRILNRMKQTGVAASVLWKSLRSVLSSANHEVRSGFEFRVASFLADIVAANAGRRTAIVGAGGGAVVDWLLESVAVSGDNSGTQAEAARALAYLIADPNVSEAVLGRPHAVPFLLRFIFTSQPQRSKKHSRHTLSDVSDSLKGRSMLVAALMDIITSDCHSLDKAPLKPTLPRNAEMSDIAAAIQVIEEGGMHLDEPHEDSQDGGEGVKGIGIKVLGGTTVLGLSRTNELMELEIPGASYFDSEKYSLKNLTFNKMNDSLLAQENVASAVVPGLWDDLICQHVAVPFAAWALANWATASNVNRAHIQELDRDGQAVMTALITAERSVKWHGCLVARLLLEDHNLPLNDSVPDWSFSLLSTVSQASKSQDIPLAEVALSAFSISIERSPAAQKVIVEKGLPLMRETAKYTIKHKTVQESLAKALESLSSLEVHMSLEESQKWSSILVHWVFGNLSSDILQSSATKILSRIFEDYGAASIPISQGWLALILADILRSSKIKLTKGSTQPKTGKVKTQVDQSNIALAQQAVSQLADAVVNLAGNRLATENNSGDTFSLTELLSLEPFAGPFKNLKKESLRKFHAADSALATLKGIKALTELCAEDTLFLSKITDYGILCLLRCFLLRDDYEQLAANEAYDASRAQELEERPSNVSGEPSAVDNDSSSIRVPPTAHIRRHAARLLTILSAVPNVQRIIVADEYLCKWLEECASGRIPGCNDAKIQSYARATLLNTFCRNQIETNSSNENPDDNSFQNHNHECPHYADMLFLINPGLPHWKCLEEDIDTDGRTSTKNTEFVVNDNLSTHDKTHSCSGSEVPSMDVVFVHGLRGGPFKSWRLSDDKSSTKSGLVEKIDEEAGKQGTFWPGEWLSTDFPYARLFTLKYKTNLTQWSGATLPLQEVSSMLLEKVVAAGIGNRPVVFVTHSMGGLVVKQMLYQAKAENKNDLVDNTIGVVFYSCPHFGSKLADMPFRMGLVLRPAPTIGELRSGSPRLVQLNDFIRHRQKKGLLEVLSLCETKVTPIVEGYGGWAFRMQVVPIESAYPGFGELVVLESTDHVNSCKPVSRDDPSYKETLEFLKKLRAQHR